MMKGSKHSEDSKKKISVSMVGKSSYNKGIPCPESVKEKISNSNKGKPAWNKGLTKETDERVRIGAEKISGINHPSYGKIGYNKNKKFPKEIYPNYGMSGKHHSEETSIKLSQNHADVSGSKNPRYGKIYKSKRFYYDSQLQGKIALRSSWELAYAKYLDQNKILWYYEIETFKLQGDMTYTPDFFLPRFEKFVEIKGFMKELDKIKIQQFQEEYPWDLEILRKEDLINLGCEI